MRAYSLTHLSDGFLLQALDTNVRQERGAMAVVLAHLAEVDARRLYLPAGFPSMFEFCVRRLHCSEQAAMKRIRAARAARRFPAIFDAVAEGRLHLSAVVLLATHLISDNADELLGAASSWPGASRSRTCPPGSRPSPRCRGRSRPASNWPQGQLRTSRASCPQGQFRSPQANCLQRQSRSPQANCLQGQSRHDQATRTLDLTCSRSHGPG
jgi:hypothetical protein